MTDSENELTNNIFSYPNVNTTVSAKGPRTNISNLSIRNQLTSTMYMPRNFERQRYAESVYEQRSMYHRRETSPMSIRSACDMRPYNFQPYSTGSHKSMYHGRSGSPMSLRSIDSTSSVSAAEIAFAFKNAKFNSHDMQIIKQAYRNLMKYQVRKRIEKNRNRRLYSRANRRSGDDSGEQGSDSSFGSDDCGSAKTTTLNNMARPPFDFTDFRRTVREDNMARECTENARQNTFKNMFSLGSRAMSTNIQHNSLTKQNSLQKDRFKNSFLLPSQRFNQSVASTVIPENNDQCKNAVKNNVKNYNHHKTSNGGYTDSENEEIFSETVKENSVCRSESLNKRPLNDDELNLPYNKRRKTSSPVKNTTKKLSPIKKSNDNFIFAKPALPTKKPKPKIQEKLISKSLQSQEKLISKSSQPQEELIATSQPLNDLVIPTSKSIETAKPIGIQEKSNTQSESETMDNTDVSMRPSFIKRKLFTQKLDVIEKSNLSNDGMNSPQSSVYNIPKEKNKTRKLVTSQSCLNREVQDDSNLLDLIHKIVPPDQMNATTQSVANQTKPCVSTSVANSDNKKDSDDKWDVTTVISMCNEDECSDTYTDEEIFKSDSKRIDPIPKVILERISVVTNTQKNIENKFKPNDLALKKVQNCVKSFWDTDSESDVDWQKTSYRSNVKENQKLGGKPETFDISDSKCIGRSVTIQNKIAITSITKQLNNTTPNITVVNNTTDNAHRFKVSNLSFRSHRLSKKKKCCNETCLDDEFKSNIELKNKSITDVIKPNAKKPKQNTVVKSKSDTQNKTVKENIPTKANENIISNKDKSESAIARKKSPNKDTKLKESEIKKTVNSKSKSKSHTQKVEKGETKIKLNKTKKTKLESGNKEQNNNVQKKKVTPSNLLSTNSVSITSPEAKNSSITRQRPLRSCRTPSQNRSIDTSKSLQLSNNSNLSKSLRSRTINISSSIENITFHFKPKSKVVNNKNMQVNTRKSDVSFSLGNKNTPTTPNISRNKGKRKT